MKKAFLIHGFGGWPNGGWRPYLMFELNKLSVYCHSLAMPDPDKPNKESWTNEILENISKHKGDEIYLVGHSLGGAAILNLLNDTETIIAGAILVSSPYWADGSTRVKDFFSTYDFAKIKSQCPQFSIIHGSNDHVVSPSHAAYLSEHLNAPLTIIPKGGHLNGGAGFDKLPKVVDELKLMLNFS